MLHANAFADNSTAACSALLLCIYVPALGLIGQPFKVWINNLKRGGGVVSAVQRLVPFPHFFPRYLASPATVFVDLALGHQAHEILFIVAAICFSREMTKARPFIFQA